MKKSKFTEQQIAFALHRQRAGQRLPRCAGKWVFRGDVLSLETAVRRIDTVRGEKAAQLEEENARLRKVVADLTWIRRCCRR